MNKIERKNCDFAAWFMELGIFLRHHPRISKATTTMPTIATKKVMKFGYPTASVLPVARITTSEISVDCCAI
jgi:hypothetical protein